MEVQIRYQKKSRNLNSKVEKLPPILKKRRNAYKEEKIKDYENDSFFWQNKVNAYEQNYKNYLTNERRTFLNGPGPGKYSRPTSIGHLNHDITIKTEPAFSICKVERFVENYESSLKFNLNSAATNKPSGLLSAESNNSKPSSSNFPCGPGAGKYDRKPAIGYVNYDLTLIHQPPAYSIGKAERTIDLSANPFLALPKSSSSNHNILPGPADYKVPITNKYKTSIPAYSIGKALRFPTIII